MPRAKQTIADIELDLGRYELRRHGRRVKIEKKPMELLIFLVARKEQLVTRQEIVTKLWRSDLFIDTEPNINNIVRKVRTALGDNSAKPQFLETVVGKGYRFVGPVKVIDARFRKEESGEESSVEHERASKEKMRTSLAVLPLVLLGNTVDDEGMCLGIADALTTRLGNLQNVDVMPMSAMLHLPSEISAADAGERLGVRFVMRGAVRESKGQWRLSLEMIDTRSHSTCFSRECDLDMQRLPEIEDEIAKQIAAALNRPLHRPGERQRPRYSKDAIAYAEFMRGYRLSSSGDPTMLEEAAQRLSTALARDPGFSLAHATLSLVCAERHFEFDPASAWLEKAEFHCNRALELDGELAEGHVAKAYLLWGPSKNFQHLEAITELRRALTLQANLPQAYNRLGTILAHIGLLERAREMYERGRSFHPKKAISPSVVQVHMWKHEYDLAWEVIQWWRAENPASKYPIYLTPVPAMMKGNWKKAEAQLQEAVKLLPEEPMVVSLQGLYYALRGSAEKAMGCVNRACAIPKSFGHAHHTYYQIAGIHALLKKPEVAFEWLERSVSTGFACWPFFASDPCLRNLREVPEFQALVGALKAKYPDHLGLL